ncbi:MAG: hypothetical protein ACOX9R_08005 [Armatimonadota bacterium]|jgi:hypothetical protein
MARKVRKQKRKLSTAAWFGIGCGAVIVVVLIVGAVLWLMVSGEPPLPPEARATGSAPSTPSPSAPGSTAPPLQQQMQYVEQAERSDQPVPVTMTIRQSELNDMLRQESTGEVRDLQVYFGTGTIAATGKVNYRGRPVHLTIRAEPVVSDGRLRLDVREVMVGRLHAPDAVREQVRGEIDRGMERAMRQHNVHVNSVHVGQDVMTVSGRVGGR